MVHNPILPAINNEKGEVFLKRKPTTSTARL